MNILDDVMDAAEAVADGIKTAGRETVGFFAQAGEDAFAEAGGHWYSTGAAIIKQWNIAKKSQGLDSHLKDVLRPMLGNVVDDIRVTFGAKLWDEVQIMGRTIGHHPHAQTFGHDIYVRAEQAPNPTAHFELLIHEACHVLQYENAERSLTRFGNRYFRGYYRASFSYKNNVMERDARQFQNCTSLRLESGRSVAELWRGQWSTGWTSFVPFVLNGEPHYLAYKLSTGDVAIDRVNVFARGVTELWRSKWTSGWTHFMPFSLNNKPHYLAYKIVTGDAVIASINADGKGVTDLWRGKWTPGWSEFVPFVLNNRPHYLAYKVGSGDVVTDRIASDGKGVEEVWRSKWTSGWSTLMPTTIAGEPHLLGYKVANGEACFDRILPDAKGTDPIWKQKWTPGWTAFFPFMFNGQANYLAYKKTTGEAGIDTPHTDSRYITEVWCHRWTQGWTHFMPFQLSGSPHYLAYKQDVGTAVISRLM